MKAKPKPLDRRSRNARVRSLAKAGWTNVAIAGELGITPQRVGQILAAEDAIAAIGDHEARLQAELDELLRHDVANRRRIRAVRRALERIDEEREANRIDQILGLA